MGLVFRDKGAEAALKGVCIKEQEIKLKNLWGHRQQNKNKLTMWLDFLSPSLITGSIPEIPKAEGEKKLLQVVFRASRAYGRQLLQKLNKCKYKQEKEDLHKFLK